MKEDPLYVPTNPPTAWWLTANLIEQALRDFVPLTHLPHPRAPKTHRAGEAAHNVTMCEKYLHSHLYN